MQTIQSTASDKFSGKRVSVFTLRNKRGTEATITNYGAIILSFKIKTFKNKRFFLNFKKKFFNSKTLLTK